MKRSGHWLLAALCGFGATVAAVAGETAKIEVSKLPEKAVTVAVELGKSSRTAGGNYFISEIPEALKGMPMVSVPRGDFRKAAPAYKVTIDRPATAYLLVQNRGDAGIPDGWTPTKDKVMWKSGASNFSDKVYTKKVEAGEVEIPAHNGKDAGGAYGIPNSVVFAAE